MGYMRVNHDRCTFKLANPPHNVIHALDGHVCFLGADGIFLLEGKKPERNGEAKKTPEF